MAKAPDSKTPKRKQSTTRPSSRASKNLVEQIRELHDTAQRFEKLQKSLLKTPGQAHYVFHYPSQQFLIGEKENAALYGYTLEEIRALPESWMSTHHPSDRKKVAASTEKFLNSGPKARAMEMQMRVLRKDGAYEWITLHRKALERDENGKVVTELGVARVITREIEAVRGMKESEGQYRALFDEAPVAILLVEPSGVILEANRTAYADLQVRSGALKGRHLDQIVTHEDRTDLRAIMRKLKAGEEESHTVMTRWGRDDGTSYPVEMTLSKLPGGKIRVTTRDLSDRESQAEALRQKDECYQGMFINNRLGVAVLDVEGCFLDVNPAFTKMVEMEKDQLCCLTLPDVVAGTSKAAANQLLRRVKRPQKEQKPDELELQIHGEGGTLPVEVTMTILEGETPATHRGILLFHDIRERKRAEVALQRESALSQVLLDNAPIAVGLLTPLGEVIRLNKTAEELFGYKTSEVKGRVMWDMPIMDAEEVLKSKRRLQSLAEGRDTVHANVTIKNRKGDTRIVDVRTTALRTYGKVDFLITTGIDITDRRRLESEVIRVAEAEQIRIGHDLHDGIGQTLTGIGALVGALEEGLEGSAKADAARIRELVGEAISENRRISHGLSPAAVKNRGLAGGLRLLAETVRKNYKAECVCQIDAELECLSEEKAIQAFRIAQEAVNNAFRHGRATKIEIKLVVREPGHCGLEISDNGKGFKTSLLKEKGGGIGIRVMQSRADLIASELHLRSAPGKGTRIILELLC